MSLTNCKNCNEILNLTLTPNSVHYGRLDCPSCHTFNGWARNPASPRFDSKRVGNHADINKVMVYHGMTEPICFFCLRNKNQLGEKETLTIDHINELDKNGKDEVYNMQILCSACHKLKNWARLYMHWHLNKDEKKDNSIQFEDGTTYTKKDM